METITIEKISQVDSKILIQYSQSDGVITTRKHVIEFPTSELVGRIDSIVKSFTLEQKIFLAARKVRALGAVTLANYNTELMGKTITIDYSGINIQ
jgi:hypothetical protein